MNQSHRVDYQDLKSRLRPIFSKLSVLVVDDMPSNIDSYRIILQEMGISRSNIHTATNGLSAFTKLTSIEPDVVIADWNMPVMDGLDFVKKVRDYERFQDLVILMITAESEADMEHARPYVNAFLRKPATNSTIEHMLLSVLSKRITNPSHPLGMRR